MPLQGGQFKPIFAFEDDSQAVCNASMAQIQDAYWIHKAAANIRDTHVHAYFVRAYEDEPAHTPPNSTTYFAVVRLTESFRLQHATHWSRLTDEDFLGLQLYNSEGAEVETSPLDAKIMNRPDTLPAMGGKHALEKQFEFDLVLELRVKGNVRDLLKTFEGRVEAEEAFGVSLLLCNMVKGGE